MNETAWVAMAGGGATALTALTGYLLSRKKRSDEHYLKILDHLQTRVQELERGHKLCLEENASLHGRLGVQQGQITELQAALARIDAGNLGAIIQADASGRIRDWNPAATALFHWSVGQAMRMKVADLIPERIRAAHEEAFLRAADPERPCRRASVQSFALRSDGTEVAVTVLLESWDDEHGKRIFQAEIRRR